MLIFCIIQMLTDGPRRESDYTPRLAPLTPSSSLRPCLREGDKLPIKLVRLGDQIVTPTAINLLIKFDSLDLDGRGC